ncbi:MAG: SCO family protein [Bacteroidota bacterium]
MQGEESQPMLQGEEGPGMRQSMLQGEEGPGMRQSMLQGDEGQPMLQGEEGQPMLQGEEGIGMRQPMLQGEEGQPMLQGAARLLLMTVISIFVIAGCGDKRQGVEAVTLPEIKPAPAFSFTNFDGRTVTNADFKGKVYIAYFFFTSCGGPCPIMNSKANVLQAEFSDAPDFRIAGFSVDPETDTVEELFKYAQRYSAKPGNWYMLRNDQEIVAQLASKGFMMGDASTPSLHSTRFALVDRKGVIRGYFDGMDDAKVEELRTAIDFLLGENS